MTHIPGIDPIFRPLPQPRDPLHSDDFAHELAKHDEKVLPKSQEGPKSEQENKDSSLTPTDIAQTASLSSNSLVNAASLKITMLPETIKEPAIAAGKVVQLTQTVQPPASVNTAVAKAEPIEQTTIAPIDVIESAQKIEALTLTNLTPVGATEVLLGARVFGWHTMAQAYLSELTLAETGADAQVSFENAQTVSPAASQGINVTPVTSDVETATIAAPSRDSPPLFVGSLVQADAQDDTASPVMAELALADGTATSYWSERSVRFTRQGDGASVAWLRDYRLPNSEAPHLVQLVLNEAKAKGLMLNKIMLNGREVWTSPTKQSGVNNVS